MESWARHQLLVWLAGSHALASAMLHPAENQMRVFHTRPPAMELRVVGHLVFLTLVCCQNGPQAMESQVVVHRAFVMQNQKMPAQVRE